ncbi:MULTISPECIES: helix-turn-helix transcriptional regulator [unclassified Streptomyces]|uniref:helix-turn-helix transcriptional regulator n=1 Tax=unclassified Streptomyces TaxID=2593676 RepID=UPI0038115EF9
MSQAERLVDTAEIVSEFGTSKPRISEWSNTPDSGFPPVARTEGRKRFWRYDEVAQFFALRAPKKRTLPASVLEADQDELLTKREVAKLLGYTRTSTIDGYVRDRPGYFPEADSDIDGPMWRRGTIVAWVSSRPGKGRRGSAPAAALPQVSAEGDPDELLGTAEVASLLGYGSVASFSSALYQGRIPELPEPDAREKGQSGRGQARKKWRRATVVAAARERGVLPSVSQDESEDLADAAEAARILGYGSTDNFLSALAHGHLPGLEQPDGYEYRRGSAGRPRQQRWRRTRLQELAAHRSSTS